LQKGPSDPRVFYDQLQIETWSEDSHRGFVSRFDVATPLGLAKYMEEENEDFLYGEDTIIVPKYDLRNIMRAVVIRFCEPEDPLRKRPESQSDEVDG
jgi:hypothetical protein